MATGCSPEEARRLAENLAKNRHKETQVIDIDDYDIQQRPLKAGEIESRRHLGMFSSIRTARALFGDYVAVNGINKVAMADTKINNWKGNLFKEYNDALKPLMTRLEKLTGGLSEEKDRQLFSIVEKIGKNGTILDPRISRMYPKEYIDAAFKIRSQLDRVSSRSGMDWDSFSKYMELVRNKGGGVLTGNTNPTETELSFIKNLTPGQKEFVKAVERRIGTDFDFEKKSGHLFSAYIHAIGHKELNDVMNKIETDVIFPYYNVGMVKNPITGHKSLATDSKTAFEAWREYKHSVLGGLTQQDHRTADTISKMSEAFGFGPVSPRAGYIFSHMMSSLFYSGTMGLRPASIIRQFGQLVPSYAEFGAKFTRQGLAAVINDLQTGGITGGPLINSYRERGLMSSHIESLVQSINAERGTTRAVGKMTEFMLKGVAAVDAFTRAATAAASDLRFNDYLKRGAIESLPGGKDVKDAVIKAVNDGKIDYARDLYASEMLAQLQYTYGKANRPEFMRGALGNMAGAFMSYPLNTFEMLRGMGGRAVKGWKENNPNDYLPLLRLMAVTTTALYAGSEYLDADLNSMFVTGSLPHSMSFPKAAMDMWQAGASTVEWQGGQLFMTGESQYHKKQRHEAWNNVGKFASNLIPGSGLYGDTMKIIDSGSFARALALTPKGEAIDRENRKRRELEKEMRRISGETKEIEFGQWR